MTPDTVIGAFAEVPCELALAFDAGDAVYIVIGVIYLVFNIIKSAKAKKDAEPTTTDFELEDFEIEDFAPEPAPASGAELVGENAWMEAQQAPAPEPAGQELAVNAATKARRRGVAADASSLLSRGRHLSNDVREVPGGAALLPALVDEILPRLKALDEAADDHAVEQNPEGMGVLERQARELDRLVSVLETVREQRRMQAGPMLGDVGVLAEALCAPVLARGRGHFGGFPLFRLFGLEAERQSVPDESLAAIGLAPVCLTPGRAAEVALWGAVAHESGRSLLAASPAFRSEVRAAMGAPERGALPPVRNSLYENDLRALLGAWYPVLAADAFGTQLLGTAYMTSLAAQFQDVRSDEELKHVRGAGGVPEQHLPPLLRLAVVRALLRAKGYDAAADETWETWHQRVGGPQDILLPFRQGMTLSIPLAPLAEFASRAASAVTTESLGVLGGSSLARLPALALTDDFEDQVERARKQLMGQDLPSGTPPRVALAAAIRAAFVSPALSAQLVRQLRALVTPRQRAAAGTLGGEAAPGSVDLRPTPDLIAGAIVFQALFEE